MPDDAEVILEEALKPPRRGRLVTDRGSAEGEDERRRAETERRGEELREAWRRRRKPQYPLRKPGRVRKPEDDGKGKR